MPLLRFSERLLIINESQTYKSAKAATERKRISWIHPPVTCPSTVCMVFHTAGLHCCLKALNTKWLGFNNSQSSQRLTRQWRRVLAPALLEVLKAAPLEGAGWYFVHLLKVRGCEGKLGGTDNNASRRVPDSKHLRGESEKNRVHVGFFFRRYNCQFLSSGIACRWILTLHNTLKPLKRKKKKKLLCRSNFNTLFVGKVISVLFSIQGAWYSVFSADKIAFFRYLYQRSITTVWLKAHLSSILSTIFPNQR